MFNCKNCGKDTSEKSSNRRSFCNFECFKDYARREKINTKREKRICANCNKYFECVPSDPKKFCNSSCAATANNKNRDGQIYIAVSKANKNAYLNGKMTGLKKGGGGREKGKQFVKRIEKICPICKKPFKIQKWQEKIGKKYCSNKCSRKRPGQGGYRQGSVRSYKSGWYESEIAGKVWLDSSYEFIMAKYLDEKKFKWIKNHKKFPYIKVDGKSANYVPDFYIEDLDLWVETKGYMTENDKRKIQYFPHKIILVGRNIIKDSTKWGF